MAFQEQSLDTYGPEKMPNMFDIRTGADAVTSGTDITDKDLQMHEGINNQKKNKNLTKKKKVKHVSHPPHSP
jgi:hypothetical protein